MSVLEQGYTGKWLHEGEWRGKEFSHELAEYHHDESPGAEGATPMRHVTLDRDGKMVGVWIPADWTDEQALQALDSNW